MSKYIIDTKEYGFSVESVILYGRNVLNEQAACATSVLDLEKLNSDYINEHYGQLQDDAYKKGFEDGKSVNDKGCDGCKYAEMGSDTTICAECCNAYHNQWTAKNDKIEVGDEVKNIYSKLKGVVTQIIDDNHMYALWQDGSTGIWNVNEVTKTGRHFDITSILEGMRCGQ